MMPTIIKLRSKRLGDHVYTDVFTAPDLNRTFAKNGTLVFRMGEWQIFGAALLIAAHHMDDHLRVISEGDEAVVEGSEP